MKSGKDEDAPARVYLRDIDERVYDDDGDFEISTEEARLEGIRAAIAMIYGLTRAEYLAVVAVAFLATHLDTTPRKIGTGPIYPDVGLIASYLRVAPEKLCGLLQSARSKNPCVEALFPGWWGWDKVAQLALPVYAKKSPRGWKERISSMVEGLRSCTAISRRLMCIVEKEEGEL